MNSVVRAGGSPGPDGQNFWSSFSTASLHSELLQSAVYLDGVVELGNLKLYYGGRLEHAGYDVELPSEIDRVSADAREERSISDDEFLWQAHLNPHLEIVPDVQSTETLQVAKVLKSEWNWAEWFRDGTFGTLAEADDEPADG